MSIKTILSPQRYVQGPGALAGAAEHLAILGLHNPLILTDPAVVDICRAVLEPALSAAGLKFAFTSFNGESTWAEVARVKQACLDGGHDAILACGGGKTLDTGRAAAAGEALNVGVVPPRPMPGVGAGVACLQAPTIASTDAPTARACLIYQADGVFDTVILAPTNPLMVLVDTEIIARAPVRTLVAGMGDAMATWFEADVCYRTGALTHAGGVTSRTARMMARLAFDILMEFGPAARLENQAGVAGPALEAVVEANILLSGLGYESGGLSAAHAIADSLTILGGRFQPTPLHGEMVSFGTLAHLLLEEVDTSLVERVAGFYCAVGLPTTFAQLGLAGVSPEDIDLVAQAAARDPLIRSMPRAASVPDDQGCFYDAGRIARALKAADAYGAALSGGESLGN